MQTITPQDLAVLAIQQPAMIGVHGFKMPAPSHPRYAAVMAHAHKLIPVGCIEDWRISPGRDAFEVWMGTQVEEGGDPYRIVITETGMVQLFRYEPAGDGYAVPIFLWNFGSDWATTDFLERNKVATITG